MTNLYFSPVSYGIHDETVQGSTSEFATRVYYPSEDGNLLFPTDSTIRPGEYPLVVFAHGDRSGEPELCPTDITIDYARWGAVVHLLARCGFVVAVPDVHYNIYSSDSTAERLEETVKWMRRHWVGREMLHHPPRFQGAPRLRQAMRLARNISASDEVSSDTKEEDYLAARTAPSSSSIMPLPPEISLGWPTALGLVGHSWGARACAKVAVRGQVNVKALASIAGTWDDQSAIDALVGANAPTLLIAGTQNSYDNSYSSGLWPSIFSPKHQAAIQGLGHWDWFGDLPWGIHPCNTTVEDPACPIGWQIASELLLGFMTKYLRSLWWLPPHLLGSAGGRPSLHPWFEDSTGCALKIRWDDPDPRASTRPAEGEVTLGGWSEAAPW